MLPRFDLRKLDFYEGHAALLYDIIAGRRDYRRLTRELFHFSLPGKMSALALRRLLRPVA